MSRSNSWWNFSFGLDEHNNNDVNSKIKKNNKIINTSKQQEDTHNHVSSSSVKELDRSNSLTSETATDISDNVSTVTTLVENSTMDNNNDALIFNAIPIPKSQNGQVAGSLGSHDEQKNKFSSSFRSWWSSSTSSLTSCNQKDSIIYNNNSMDEKQKALLSTSTSNLTGDKSKLSKHDKQFIRHDNSSSISILTPINEDVPQKISSSNSLKNSRSSSPSSSNTSLNKLVNTDSNTEIVDKKIPTHIGKSSDSLNSSTVPSKPWWMFGGSNNTNNTNNTISHDDINKTNLTETSTQMKEVRDTNKQIDQISNKQNSSKNKNTTDNIGSSASDSEISSSNERTRRVKKKSSSEIRRWTIFGTWSSSSNLLDSTSDGENSKTVDEEANSKKSSSSKSDTTKNVGSSTKEGSKSDDSHDSKNIKRPKNRRRSTNPITETLSDNSSSWVHFFSNVSHSQSKHARIDKATGRKMITDGSGKDSLKVTSTVEVEKKTDVQTVNVSPTLKPVPVSVVLPTFEEFIRNKPHRCPSSVVQQTLHAINSYFFPPEKSLESTLPKWLDEITRSTVDVKRIAIIGVHGWYPATARMIRAVVGEPTGTSPKFCDMMAKAVLGYLSKHGIVLPSNAITCIPLEGEGTISVREELLHKNLLHNKTWCEALSSADVVFIATHSQGTPVSTILLSRLIKERLIHPKRQRICMLAMAGVSHGPFAYLKESFIVKYYVGAGRSHDADAARELFEFMNSESLVSKKYKEALSLVIQNGVKVVYVGSMDDQVVPLYSSLFTGVNHPSIMRAVYIDGPLYQANDFLTNLIVFTVRLRNAGILDHGLMVQLSKVVAGSMYGEGHSALYTEVDVYTMAVRYLFETPSLGTFDLNIDKFVAQQKHNPYYLPWAMRGILEDKGISESRYFTHEVLKLRKQYEEWEPTSKAMKEVKFQLEPLKDAILSVKSKL